MLPPNTEEKMKRFASIPSALELILQLWEPITMLEHAEGNCSIAARRLDSLASCFKVGGALTDLPSRGAVEEPQQRHQIPFQKQRRTGESLLEVCMEGVNIAGLSRHDGAAS